MPFCAPANRLVRLAFEVNRYGFLAQILAMTMAQSQLRESVAWSHQYWKCTRADFQP